MMQFPRFPSPFLSEQQRADAGFGFGEPKSDPASTADLNNSLGDTGIPAGARPETWARDASFTPQIPASGYDIYNPATMAILRKYGLMGGS